MFGLAILSLIIVFVGIGWLCGYYHHRNVYAKEGTPSASHNNARAEICANSVCHYCQHFDGEHCNVTRRAAMQYRLLNVGEIIQRGDEYYNHRFGWKPIRRVIGKVVQPKDNYKLEVGSYRRPLENSGAVDKIA